MKRTLFIATGAIGGLGATLVVIHPHFGSSTSLPPLPTSKATVTTIPTPKISPQASRKTVPSPVATPIPTESSTPVATPTPTESSTPVATPTTKEVSGTFTGDIINVNYGNVQVQITVVNGKITDAQALQAPSGRSAQYSQYALPILRKQTLAAQNSNIQGATGASYTSYGWSTSLQSAIVNAGL